MTVDNQARTDGLRQYSTSSLSFAEHPNPEQLEEFVGEISTMKRVGRHANVVRLLGFCTTKQPYMMVMEFVPCGDLVIVQFVHVFACQFTWCSFCRFAAQVSEDRSVEARIKSPEAECKQQ
jgi:serine/threonine protein kinase